jgi:hypothetical protein
VAYGLLLRHIPTRNLWPRRQYQVHSDVLHRLPKLSWWAQCVHYQLLLDFCEHVWNFGLRGYELARGWINGEALFFLQILL